ncbi:hypothetical protein KVR01_002652 [Diaporthe batatas]|uniref:uncharacterized protein n=1 Tax=Diaporthe batatas TaxID=748121 RepID=UPI001D0413CA|nr:uncharacterized protein KVR01_002652 [Diaporthe batatas]KAG8166963.1 hypothetical protein KVR01_002652 [Diaporthe batatas]
MSSITNSIRSTGASEDESDEISQSVTLAGLSPTCQTCVDIWACLNRLTSQRSYTLGSFADVLAAGCPDHTPLIRSHEEACRAYGTDTSQGTVEVTFEPNTSTANLHDSRYSRQWNISIVQEPSIPGHQGTTKVLSPEWADLKAAKQWKKQCLEDHGEACDDTMGVKPDRPAWVIDVQENCIVPGESCPSFVALSYVWGKYSWLRVDAETLKLMQIPGALVENPEIATNLAPIVCHAMYLTAFLEERYLWIDSICIVQDSENLEDLNDQLNRMGGFYGSAVVTIIAADGDSKTGLPGIKGVSQPRQLVQKIIPFGKERLVVSSILDDRRHILGTDYDRRGWTYQEYELSKRRLIFQEKRLRWECKRHLVHEDLVHPTQERPRWPALLDVARGFPDLSALQFTMLRYNSRKFSHEQDAIPGITGLLSIWSRTFTGGFLCGMPEMFFDRSLGWMPREGNTDLRRRTSSQSGQTERESDTSMAILPSWSWLGWEGEVQLTNNFWGGAEAIRYSYGSWEIEETIPTTTWYTSSEAHGGTMRRIRSTWYGNRDSLYKDDRRPLPPGWSRSPPFIPHSSEQGRPSLYPAGCKEQLFKHDSQWWTTWYYPFPVVNFADAPQVVPKQTSYLFCKTQRARFFASPKIAEKKPNERSNVLSLYLGPNEESIGELQAHNARFVEDLFSAERAGTEASGNGPPSLASVEVIVIYESLMKQTERKTGDAQDERSDSCSWRINTFHKYAVLWIEWEEGVAYRKGIGHVDKASWQISTPENIDLVLG